MNAQCLSPRAKVALNRSVSTCDVMRVEPCNTCVFLSCYIPVVSTTTVVVLCSMVNSEYEAAGNFAVVLLDHFSRPAIHFLAWKA